MDPDLYNKCEEDYDQSCIDRQHHIEERKHRWEILQQAAASGSDSSTLNHTDTMSTPAESAMQIDSTVNVPAKIPEEHEPEHRETDETTMSVDTVAPPA
jgi:hypothetical protein